MSRKIIFSIPASQLMTISTSFHLSILFSRIFKWVLTISCFYVFPFPKPYIRLILLRLPVFFVIHKNVLFQVGDSFLKEFKLNGNNLPLNVIQSQIVKLAAKQC